MFAFSFSVAQRRGLFNRTARSGSKPIDPIQAWINAQLILIVFTALFSWEMNDAHGMIGKSRPISVIRAEMAAPPHSQPLQMKVRDRSCDQISKLP
jgi:hypothetical protein